MSHKTTLLIPTLILLIHPAVHGQGAVPLGEDIQINTYTFSQQREPAVSALADGGFVVVWESFFSNGTDQDITSVQSQRFAADGTPVGTEQQVNSSTSGAQFAPAAASLAGSDFVVAWSSLDSTGSDTSYVSIQAQRYGGDGSAVGGEFQVNTHTPSFQWYAKLAPLADGGFVVVWMSDTSSGTDSDNSSIQGRRYAADSTPLGPDFQINSYTTSSQSFPDVATLADGSFTVVWTSDGSPGTDSSDSSIQGQRYAADGSALGTQFQVNAFTPERQLLASVAASGGGFVVAWEGHASAGSDTLGRSVHAQRFAADASPLGGELQVNTDTTANQWTADLAAHDDGSFVVVWRSDDSNGPDTSGWTIRGRRYDAGGASLGDEFQINSYTPNSQFSPAVATLDDDGFVTTWTSGASGGSDASSSSIQARRFARPRFTLAGLGGKCLDVEAADPTDGTPVVLFDCHGGANQRWRMELTAVPQRVVGLDDKCLVPGPTGDSGDLRVVIGACGGPDDLWQLITTGPSNPSALVHAETGLCLDVEGGVDDDGTPIILFDCHGGANQVWRPAPEVCTRDAQGLCLNQDRFRIDLDWRSFDGTTGSGRVVPVGSSDSGLLWFFEADNWEMLVKVLDGCAINDRLWVFAAATTTVEYTLRVTDTATGDIQEYFNPLGEAADAITDTDAFATCSAAPESADTPPAVDKTSLVPRSNDFGQPVTGFDPKGICLPSQTNLCLSDNRFHLEAEWRDFDGNTGAAQAVPMGSPDSGLFWFFDSTNWEMLIKVLDACDSNGRFWLLAAATTDVEYTLRVTDTATGELREYFNPLGEAAAALVDTFDSCP